MPNLTGWQGFGCIVFAQYLGGVFIPGVDNVPAEGRADGKSGGNMYFNASSANSIYGASKTVTPLSRKVTFLIRY